MMKMQVAILPKEHRAEPIQFSSTAFLECMLIYEWNTVCEQQRRAFLIDSARKTTPFQHCTVKTDLSTTFDFKKILTFTRSLQFTSPQNPSHCCLYNLSDLYHGMNSYCRPLIKLIGERYKRSERRNTKKENLQFDCSV